MSANPLQLGDHKLSEPSEVSSEFQLSPAARAEIGVAAGLTLHEQLLAFKALVVNQAILAYHGNQVHAAAALGIHRNTFSRIVEDLRDANLLKSSLRRRDYRKAPGSVQGEKL